MNLPSPAQADGVHTITVNDQPRPIKGATTLATVVDELGLGGRKGVAVAVNGEVVARGAWPAHVLRPGDRVLMIRATQGG